MPDKSNRDWSQVGFETLKLAGSVVLGAFISGASLIMWAETHFTTRVEFDGHVAVQDKYQGVTRVEFDNLARRVDDHLKDDRTIDKRLSNVEIAQKYNNAALVRIGNKLGVYVESIKSSSEQ